MDKTINLNVAAKVAPFRQPISMIGSGLGKAVTLVRSLPLFRGGLDGYEKLKHDVNAKVVNEYYLNECPCKYVAKGYTIVDTHLEENEITNEMNVVVVLENGQRISIPATQDMVREGEVTPEKIKRAIDNKDPNIFFFVAREVVKIINPINRSQIAKIERLEERLRNYKMTLTNACNENDQLVERLENEWFRSAPTQTIADAMKNGNGSVMIDVHQEEE